MGLLKRAKFYNDFRDVLKNAVRKKSMDVSEIEEKILNIIKSKPGLSENAYMGLIMKEIKGISGREAREIIGKYVK